MLHCHNCRAVISSGHQHKHKGQIYHTDCVPIEPTATLGVENIEMSMRSKLSQALNKGVELERTRCMELATKLMVGLRKGLNKKLMSAHEKHFAELKLQLGEALIGALQMKIMSGEQPDAETKASEVHGRDADAMGGTQGGEDDGRAG